MGKLFLHTLGTARIDAGATRLTPSSVRKFALLLHLSDEPGRRVPRDVLRDLIFPDRTALNAQHSLRELVYGFRRIGVRIDADKHGLALASDAVVSDYGQLLEGERPEASQLAAASGGFLPGYAPEHSEAYTEWLEGYRARATFELCKALLKELARAKRVGDWSQAERAARACLALDPMNEEATLGLAEMLAIGGAKVAAVRLLDEYIREVGSETTDLRIPASLLRRRISEQSGPGYRTPTTLPFVGRADEMAAIFDRVARSVDGEASCIILHGEPGIGKTRLAEEACARAAVDGVRVERIVIQQNDRERPFAAFVDLVPKLRELPGALGASPESLQALRRLTTHVDPDATRPREPEALRSLITRGIDDLIEAITSEVPLLVFVDDAQWLDDMSLCVLAGLASTRRQRRLCILLTSRDASLSRLFLARVDRAFTMKVSPLPVPSCEELVSAVAASAIPRNPSLRKWLAATSAGNPFFLQALIAHYLSTNEPYAIPPTINALLDRCVLSLSDTARGVMTACVTLGRYSTLLRLLRVLEVPHIQLFSAMTELESANLISQADDRISARHSLIAEAVTRHATPVAMKAHHARIADVLESEARSTRESAMYWVCAEQWLAAGDIARAIDLLNECVQHAVEIGRPREAAELLIRAATLSSDPLRQKLARDAVRIAHAASEAEVVARGLDLIEADDQAEQHDDIELAGLYARGLCELDPERALRFTRCVLDHEVEDEHRVAAGWMMLVVADYQRTLNLAAAVFDRLDPMLRPAAERSDVQALIFYLVYHSCFGDVDESAAIADRLMELAHACAPAARADIRRKSAIAYWRAGLTDCTLRALKNAFEAAVEAGLARIQLATSMMLAGFLQDISDDEQSAVWKARAERVSDEFPGTLMTIDFVTLMSELALGRADRIEIIHYAKVLREQAQPDHRSRAARWINVLELTEQLAAGVEVDVVSSVRLLTTHHVKGAERGDTSDGEIAIAARILGTHHDAAAARDLLSRYFGEYRTGRAPVSRFLSTVIHEVAYSPQSMAEGART